MERACGARSGLATVLPGAAPWAAFRRFLVFASLTFLPGAPLADEGVPQPLGPDVGPRLLSVLSVSVAPWQVQAIEVGPQRARVRLCQGVEAADACAELVLWPVAAACNGFPVGPWCLGVSGPSAEALFPGVLAAAAVVPRTLAAVESHAWRHADWRTAVNAWPPAVLVVAWFLLPAGVGVLTGWGLRRVARGSKVRRWGAVALVLAGGAALLASRMGAHEGLRPGLWDALALWGLGSLGVLATALPERRWLRDHRYPLMLLAISVAVALAGSELAARALGLAVPMVGGVSTQLFVGPRDALPSRDVCNRLFAPTFVDGWRRPLSRARPDAAVVVHLGDSMVEGNGVASEDAFPGILDRQATGVLHLNSGISGGVGPDGFYFRLRQILAQRRPDRVILYLNPQNDLEDLDGILDCCGQGFLFAPSTQGPPRSRCDVPDWTMTPRQRLASSPSILPLRVLQERSVFLRALLLLGNRLATRLGGHSQHAAERPDRWLRFAQMLAAIRDDLSRESVELLVVVLPDRFAFDAARADRPADRTRARRMESLSRELGLPTYWAWDHFEELVSRNGTEALFLGPPDVGQGSDPHFNRRGHAEMATWIRRHLPADPRH